jgi:pimeloyl-ACP methyl ester carboxylesterase
MLEKPALSPRLLTSDGVELVTRTWLADGQARAVVVLVHGLSSTKDHPHVVALAEDIRGRGFDVMSYDARGHGGSGGVSTLGDLERHDVAAAVTWSRTRHASVALVGASMGASAVLQHAADDPRLSGIVVVSSPAEWRLPLRIRALLTTVLARTAPGRWFAARHGRVRIHPEWNAPEPPRLLAARVTSRLAVVHGRRDPMIPVRSSLSLTLAGDPTRHVVVVPGMGHAFDPVGHHAVCEALTWVFDGAGETQ